MNRMKQVARARLRGGRLRSTGAFLLSAALILLLGAQAASATTVHGNFVGTNFDYLGVEETSSYGDPEPLFGVPIIVGDSLVFSPMTFSASATGAGGFDQTGALLESTIMATGAQPISFLNIQEFGEIDLSGLGTGATGGFISMSGIVTVLETLGGGACVGPACQIGFVGTFTPSDLYGLPGDLGQTLFQGNVSVDLSAPYPLFAYPGYSDVTKAVLSFDNDIIVSSEAGTTAIMEKKPTIIITVVPEPSVSLLLGGGLIVLSLRRRACRA